MYLLDNDVLLELLKKDPSENVTNWCTNVPSESLYISVLTLGMLKIKIEKTSSLQQRSLLNCWIQSHFIKWFGKNILPVDIKVAQRWGSFDLNSEQVSSLIAATAVEYNFVLVTSLNSYKKDGLKLFNPFI